jgi:hypothetical protein
MLVLGAFHPFLWSLDVGAWSFCNDALTRSDASTLQRFVTHFPSKLFACLIIHSNFFGLASAL